MQQRRAELADAVNSFLQQVSRTDKIVEQRKSVLQRLEKALPKDHCFLLFGSCASGLDYSSSDLDLCVVPSPNCPQPAQNTHKILDDLELKIVLLNDKFDVKAVPKALVPILKIEDAVTGLRADISHSPTGNANNRFKVTWLCYLSGAKRSFLLSLMRAD